VVSAGKKVSLPSNLERFYQAERCNSI